MGNVAKQKGAIFSGTVFYLDHHVRFLPRVGNKMTETFNALKTFLERFYNITA